MDIAEYKEQLYSIKRSISMLKIKAKYFADSDYENELDLYIKEINEDRFELLVVGEFSRGKSTLINALLGKSIIPSSRNPTTATLNVIKNGIVDEYTAVFYDGSKKKVSYDEFRKIIAIEDEDILSSKEGQDRVEKIGQIYFMEIRTPNPFGELGIDIIDTPGVNDLNSEREKITFDYIPKADSAIIVLAADELLSASELEFLTQNILKNQITKLFVAINFKDILNAADEQRVLESCKKSLDGIVPGDRIFLLSARDALRYRRAQRGESIKNAPENIEDSGITYFEKSILNYLAGNIGEIKLERYVDRICESTEMFCKKTVERRLNSILMSVDELGKQIKTLGPELERQKIKCSNCLDKLKSTLEMEENELVAEYRNSLQRTAVTARSIVESYNGVDPDELFHEVRRGTYQYEKDIQYDMPIRHRKQIMSHVNNTLDTIKEVCPDVSLNMSGLMDFKPNVVGQINPGALDAISYNEVFCSEKTIEEGVHTLKRVAGAAAIAVVSVGLSFFDRRVAQTALRAAVSVFKDRTGYNKIEEKYADTKHYEVDQSSMRKVFMEEIQLQYFDGIEDSVNAYRNSYKKCVAMIIKQIDLEFTSKAAEVLKQMENELKNKLNRTNTAKEEYDKACRQRNEILVITNNLKGLGHAYE